MFSLGGLSKTHLLKCHKLSDDDVYLQCPCWFSHCCDKTPKRSSLKEQDLFQLTAWSTAYPSSTVAGKAQRMPWLTAALSCGSRSRSLLITSQQTREQDLKLELRQVLVINTLIPPHNDLFPLIRLQKVLQPATAVLPVGFQVLNTGAHREPSTFKQSKSFPVFYSVPFPCIFLRMHHWAPTSSSPSSLAFTRGKLLSEHRATSPNICYPDPVAYHKEWPTVVQNRVRWEFHTDRGGESRRSQGAISQNLASKPRTSW